MNEDKFLSEFIRLRKRKERLPLVNKIFKEALFSYGSETEENISCIEEIEYREITERDGRISRGLFLRSSGFSLPDVLNFAENTPIPDRVSEEFPDLTQKEWDAIIRLAVLVLGATDT